MIEMYQTPAVCICYGNWAYCSNARGMDGVESQVQTVVRQMSTKAMNGKTLGPQEGNIADPRS